MEVWVKIVRGEDVGKEKKKMKHVGTCNRLKSASQVSSQCPQVQQSQVSSPCAQVKSPVIDFLYEFSHNSSHHFFKVLLRYFFIAAVSYTYYLCF